MRSLIDNEVTMFATDQEAAAWYEESLDAFLMSSAERLRHYIEYQRAQKKAGATNGGKHGNGPRHSRTCCAGLATQLLSCPPQIE
jgi:hypothetical protein